MNRTHRLVSAVLGLGTVGLISCGGAESRVPVGVTETRWTEGERRGQWRVLFTGYGEVFGDDQQLHLAPEPPEQPNETHAALVITDETYPEADFEVSVHTVRQLRHGVPNPWEVGWVLWNYTSRTRFYSVALKPNGWEVAKQDPAYRGAQRFLRSGTEPQFPIGRTYRVRVTQTGGVIVVSADGTALVTFVDDERPYSGGSIGVYTEDAAVHFSNLVITDGGRAPVSRRAKDPS